MLDRTSLNTAKWLKKNVTEWRVFKEGLQTMLHGALAKSGVVIVGIPAAFFRQELCSYPNLFK